MLTMYCDKFVEYPKYYNSDDYAFILAKQIGNTDHRFVINYLFSGNLKLCYMNTMDINEYMIYHNLLNNTINNDILGELDITSDIDIYCTFFDIRRPFTQEDLANGIEKDFKKKMADYEKKMGLFLRGCSHDNYVATELIKMAGEKGIQTTICLDDNFIFSLINIAKNELLCFFKKNKGKLSFHSNRFTFIPPRGGTLPNLSLNVRHICLPLFGLSFQIK